MMPRPAASAVRAFTLVELLVVIGIIALLISILLPTLSAARRSAQTTTCLSNVRQIVTASVAYSTDNNGILAPHAVEDGNVYRLWWLSIDLAAAPFTYDHADGLLHPYWGDTGSYRSIPICPSMHETDALTGVDPYDYKGYSMAFNHYGQTSRLYEPVNMGRVRRATEKVYYADSAFPAFHPTVGVQAPSPWIHPTDAPAGSDFSGGFPSVHARHGDADTANVGWFDGHASTEKVTHFGTARPAGITDAEWELYHVGDLDVDDDPATTERFDLDREP